MAKLRGTAATKVGTATEVEVKEKQAGVEDALHATRAAGPMVFAEMKQANLYPPQYRQNTGSAVETVTVVLLNHSRPSVWDEASDFLDRHAEIANADVVRIAQADTLKASKMLRAWCDDGVLEPLPGRGKRNMAYRKPQAESQDPLFSEGADNNA